MNYGFNRPWFLFDLFSRIPKDMVFKNWWYVLPFFKKAGKHTITFKNKPLNYILLLKDLSCFGSSFGNDPNTELKQLNLFGQVTKPTKIT